MEAEIKRKTFTGTVVSDKMTATRVVSVSRTIMHERYKKVLKRKKKYYVHDQNNESHAGDKVSFVECRPLSKLKRWRLVKVLTKVNV